jgi:uncharacterized protein (TIGR03118 family)
MNKLSFPARKWLASVSMLAGLAQAPAHAGFDVTNLVTDDPLAHPAQVTDPGLLNAWGLSYGPNGPFWISSNGAGTSVVYAVDPSTQATTIKPLVVSIPGEGSVTGQVFNSLGSGFNNDAFLFVSEDGTVSGWKGGSTATTLQPASEPNIYKGIAFAAVNNHAYGYGANFGTGSIDVFRGDALAPALSGHFTDPNLPAGYTPFNVQNLGGTLYVSYALRAPGADDETAGPGLGIVDSFDLQGNLLSRVATGGALNAPWGMAMAPSSFGAMAGDLLVGNFGDGRINIFDPTTHAFLGQATNRDGSPLSIDGLWAISPGNGKQAGSTSLLYFTAGPDDESHGLFGVLMPSPVPEPASAMLLLAGLALVGTTVKRRHA